MLKGFFIVLKVSKKQIKIVSLSIALFFILGIVGVAVSQNSTSHAASAPAASNVGKVNADQLVAQHPDMAKAQETYNAEVEQAKKEFDAKTASMNDKEKQDYYNQVQQRLANRQQELITPIIDKVNAAIKAVADAKGLSVVVDAGIVIYGGTDITEEVSKKLTGK